LSIFTHSFASAKSRFNTSRQKSLKIPLFTQTNTQTLEFHSMAPQNKRSGQITMDRRKKERNFLALQRNLLCLNAAFEAARAGEVGAEFFMEVNEVGNIARQWAKPTVDKNKKGN
jgi:hypothetical protein